MNQILPIKGRLAGLALLVSSFAACQNPAVDRPDVAPFTGGQVLESASQVSVPATVTVSERLGDQDHDAGQPWTLNQVLTQITRHNPDLVRARAGLQQAQAGLQMSQASYWPELSLGLQFVSTDNPGQGFGMLLNQQRLNLGAGFDATPGITENWRKELRVDWTLWNPERAAQNDAAQAGERGAQAMVMFVEEELRNAGVQAWFGLQAVRALQEVQEESILVVEERLQKTQKRRELGAALKADVLRLQVRLARAQQNAASAELQVQTASSGLNRLMARSPRAPLAFKQTPDQATLNLSPTGKDIDQLLALALEQRKDLRAAQQNLQRLMHEDSAAQRSGGPRIAAFGAYDVDGHDLNLDTDLDSYMLGVGLHLPLSKRTPARQAASRAQLMGARAALHSLSLAIQAQVSDAQERLRVARVQLQLSSSAVATAEEAYRIIAEAQDAGGATVTDVLEAEDARRQARVAQVAAKFNVQIAQAQLAKAVGTPW